MSKKQLIFVDDSGDPGFKSSASSPIFMMAAVAFSYPEIARCIDKEISSYRRTLNWRDNHEFKFSKLPKSIKLQFLKLVNKYPFDIYATCIRKSDYPILFQFTNNEKLYNWTTKELLSSIPLEHATVVVDGKYGKKYESRIRSYMRRELNTTDKKIASFKAKESHKDNLLQLADIIAGTINRSFQLEKTDNQEYIKIIRNKIIELRWLDLYKP